MESELANAQKIHQQYIQKVEFREIQHVPDKFIQEEISIHEECLCVTHGFFEKYYPILSKAIKKIEQPRQEIIWICELLLIMNGQNDKAWNIKKGLLLKGQLDLQRQMKFNTAVCFKNKKSSSYYDYRIRIVQNLIEKMNKQQLINLYKKETEMITKILARFFRNYFCWMYRNRLFKLLLPHCGQQLIDHQLNSLHKFLESNPNDYSAYSRIIVVVGQNKCNIKEELRWLNELEQFCKVAYEKEESYFHIGTYRQYLMSAQKQEN